MLKETQQKLTILFLCTGNSCRSQMAEGWAKDLKLHEIESYSAGTKPQGINPYAIEVMKEVGIDIANGHSKHINTLNAIEFDFIITVCDIANESCPIDARGKNRFHVSFEDPPKLAEQAKSKEEALPHYRRVRDEIRDFIKTLPGSILNIRTNHD